MTNSWTAEDINDREIIKFEPRDDDIKRISSNVYYVRGLRALVDLGGPPYSESLMQALESQRVTLSKINMILLTHIHADHVGNQHLFSGVPVFAPQEEIEAFYEKPGETLNTAFTWRLNNPGSEPVNVGRQAEHMVRVPTNYYMHPLSWLEEHRGAGRLERLEDLGDLEQDRLGYLQLPPRHSLAGAVYFFNGVAFIGDMFAPFACELGDVNGRNPFNLRSLLKKLREHRGRGYQVCPGHDSAYFKNKEVVSGILGCCPT